MLISITASACGGQSSDVSQHAVTAAPTASPTRAPSPTPPPEATSGILAVSFNGSNTLLSRVDPQTGTFAQVAVFTPRDPDVQLDYSITRFVGMTPVVMRALFSSDYRLTVASKRMADGGVHVGWVDRQGSFTDVSAAAAPSGDFSAIVADDTPMFGGDGAFYFASRKPSSDWIKNTPTIMTATIDDPTAVTRVPDQSGVEGNDVNYWVQPDGRVEGLCASCVPFFANGVDGRGAFDVQDWISETEYVFKDHEGTMLSLGRAQDRTAWANKIGFNSQGSDLLPETNRKVWSPVVSPDGSTLAFLSSAGETTDIFVLAAMNGQSGVRGEPRKMAGSGSGPTPDMYLLDWHDDSGMSATKRIAAAPTPAPTATASPARFTLNATVVLNQDRVVLRAHATRSSGSVGVLAQGTELTILAGPVEAEGALWWQVDDGRSHIGWVIDEVLDGASAP